MNKGRTLICQLIVANLFSFQIVYADPGENLHINQNLIIRVQAALGVTLTGELGDQYSETRQALREFQMGMSKTSSGTGWPDDDTQGKLTDRSLSLIPYLSPTDKDKFYTLFERGFYGNPNGVLDKRFTEYDPMMIEAMIDFVGVPKTFWPKKDEIKVKGMALIRVRLAEIRQQKNIEPLKGGVLDSKLCEFLFNQNQGLNSNIKFKGLAVEKNNESLLRRAPAEKK